MTSIEVSPGALVFPNTPAAKLALRQASYRYVARDLRNHGLPDLADFVASLAPSGSASDEPADSAERTAVMAAATLPEGT